MDDDRARMVLAAYLVIIAMSAVAVLIIAAIARSGA